MSDIKSLGNNEVAEAAATIVEPQTRRGVTVTTKKSNSFVINASSPIWEGAVSTVIDDLYDFQQLQIQKVWTDFGVRGENVEVFVIDTGSVDHPSLSHQGKYDKKSFIPNQPKVIDGTGHGTWVASKISGQGVGLAPRSNLHVLQSLDQSGTGSSAYSTAALDYVLNFKTNNPKIVNMSLGSFQKDSNQEEILKALYNNNVIVVAAAGNSNVNQPFYPAASPHTIGVACYDVGYNKASFSNYGPYVDISAPGVSCYGAYLNNYYRKLNGTSMASPIVTGVLVLGISYLVSKKEPVTFQRLYEALTKAAKDRGAKGRDPIFGFGSLDAINFLKILAQT